MTSSASDVPDRRLDGNALAGPLLDLFAVDLSGAVGTCSHCGSSGALGEQPLYADAPALVLRCRDCAQVLLRLGTGGGHVRIDVSGLQLLVARTPAETGPTGPPS